MNMQRFMGLATCAALGLVALPLHAATITVNSTTWENPSVVNGNCTLGEAFLAAKKNIAVDGCPAGSTAADTVVLQAGATYTLTSNPGNVWAFGANNLAVEGNGATIERSSAEGTPAFGLFQCNGTSTFSQVTLRNGRIADNSASGATLKSSFGTLTLKNVTIEDSFANLMGGAIANEASATVHILDSRLLNNISATSTHGGGAVFNQGTLIVQRSTFKGNTANRGGAITNWGVLGVSDSTFDSNQASQDGAAIYTVVVSGSAGNSTLSNSTVTNHISTNGATITNDTNGQTTIVNSTIAGNQAPALKQVSGTLSVQSSLLAGNTGSPCKEGTITSAGNNLLDADAPNCTFTPVDSDLVASEVTTVGLGTFTDSGTAGRGYFPLLSGSQAINAGNASKCIDDSANNGPDLDQDQLGNARVGTCDIGAIEATCGDSVVHANLNEACDDGNTTAGDGCSATCTVESGFACNGAPSTCATTCGDGVVAGAEQCDGAALAGATCASVTPATPAGTLACKADCTLDTTQCTAAAGPDGPTPEPTPTEPEPKSEPVPSPTPAPVPSAPEPSPVAEPTPAPAPAEGGGGCSLVVR